MIYIVFCKPSNTYSIKMLLQFASLLCIIEYIYFEFQLNGKERINTSSNKNACQYSCVTRKIMCNDSINTTIEMVMFIVVIS